ncbi:MAG: hypothetical protein HRT45_11455 [Bdellovibrionales bacterium]|nr:hypothetical protein [Bdellovibrionales bacterium]
MRSRMARKSIMAIGAFFLIGLQSAVANSQTKMLLKNAEGGLGFWSDSLRNDRLSNDFIADFNGDGLVDKLECTSRSIKILEASSSRPGTYSQVFSYQPNPSTKTIQKADGPHVLDAVISECVAVKLAGPGSLPLIAFSTSFSNDVPAAQNVLVNTTAGNGQTSFSVKKIVLSGGDDYMAAARGLACTDYPSALVSSNNGRKHGALCFYAGYIHRHGNIGFNETRTALFKFELDANQNLVVRDLTESSGLPWVGGAKGTHQSRLPKIFWGSPDHPQERRHGAFIMDGTFMDYNNDGFPDLVTVGMHGSMRLATFRPQTTAPQGIDFNMSFIQKVQLGDMSEFLQVRSFSEANPRLPKNCLVAYGQNYPRNLGGVPLHVRCYVSGQWQTYFVH